jgi:hypothetical protein
MVPLPWRCEFRRAACNARQRKSSGSDCCERFPAEALSRPWIGSKPESTASCTVHPRESQGVTGQTGQTAGLFKNPLFSKHIMLLPAVSTQQRRYNAAALAVNPDLVAETPERGCQLTNRSDMRLGLLISLCCLVTTSAQSETQRLSQTMSIAATSSRLGPQIDRALLEPRLAGCGRENRG